DRGEPDVDEARQALDGRAVRARGGECADVNLVQHLPPNRHAAPASVAPRIARRIDDLRRPVRPLRLKARRGIRSESLAVEAEHVARARENALEIAREIPVGLRIEPMHPIDLATRQDRYELDRTSRRGPDAGV